MSARNRRSSTRNKSSSSSSTTVTTPADQTANNNNNSSNGANHDHSEEVTSTTVIPTEVIVHDNEIIIDNNLKRSGSNNSISELNININNSNNNNLTINENNNVDCKDIEESSDVKLICSDQINNVNSVYTLSTKDISVIKETASLTTTTTATIGDTIVAVVPVIQSITGNQIQPHHQSLNIFNHGQQIIQQTQIQQSSSSATTTTTTITPTPTASTIIHDEITKALAINTKAPVRVIVTTETRPGPSGVTPKTLSLTTLKSSSPIPTTPTQNNSFEAADSNSGNTPSKSFVVCKVCGDKASGYHYGVTSCEGCKGFFRRSIQKQIEYKCLRDGKCLVIRLNRNRCQYCRFKKCIAVGMSRDSVRYGRVPKRSREKGDDNRVTTSEADQSANVKLDTMQISMYEIISAISQAHHNHCAYTDEHTQNLMRKPAIFKLEPEYSSSPDYSPSSITADSLEQQKINMWQRFADFITPSISRVVEFAKRIPGFLELSQDDQLILIKSGFFEIWIVHISKMVNSLDNTLTFSDGSYITRQQMELMFDYEFVSSIFNFMLSFNNLHLNDTEIGLFSALVLLSLERFGISDIKAIHRIQESIAEALRLQIIRHHSNDTQLHPNVMMKLPELVQLGIKHAEHLSWFRANWTKLKLPPLFAEIFDIPKSEDELLLVAQ